MKYIVTNAHQYNGTIYQEAYLCNDREEAENVFDSFVEDNYINIMGDLDDLDAFKADNIRQGWVFDYETGDCTEQYHTEIFETE